MVRVKKCPICKVKIANELISNLAVKKLINASTVYCYTRVPALETGGHDNALTTDPAAAVVAAVPTAGTSDLASITARGRASWKMQRLISTSVAMQASRARILDVMRWWLAKTWPSTRRLVSIAQSHAGCVESKQWQPSSHSTSLCA
jgi:hypothetical protein